MAAEKVYAMIFKKYCSKHFILRLLMLLALIGSAAVFDMYHSVNQKIAGSSTPTPASDDTAGSKIFFCNQVNTYNLKTPASEFSVRFRLACTQDKFLIKHYNLRTFQLMKAESLHSSIPLFNSVHSLPFNRVIYFSPDDIPPLS